MSGDEPLCKVFFVCAKPLSCLYWLLAARVVLGSIGPAPSFCEIRTKKPFSRPMINNHKKRSCC